MITTSQYLNALTQQKEILADYVSADKTETFNTLIKEVPSLKEDGKNEFINDITVNGTNFAYFLYQKSFLTTTPWLNTSNGNGFASMFYGCSKLVRIPPLDTSKGMNLGSMFYGCNNLTTIDGISLASATIVTSMFYGCKKLQNLNIVGEIKRTGLSLSDATLLTVNSLMSVINALYDYAAEGSTDTYKLTLGTTNLAGLTDEQKAIATAKGWTLA